MKQRIIENNEKIVKVRVSIKMEEVSEKFYKAEIAYCNKIKEQLQDKLEILVAADVIKHLQKCILKLNSNLRTVQCDLRGIRARSTYALNESRHSETVYGTVVDRPYGNRIYDGQYLRARTVSYTHTTYSYTLNGEAKVIATFTPLQSNDPYDFEMSDEAKSIVNEIKRYDDHILSIYEQLKQKEILEEILIGLRNKDSEIRREREENVNNLRESLEVLEEKYRLVLMESTKEYCFEPEILVAFLGGVMSQCTVKPRPGCCSFSKKPCFAETQLDIEELYKTLFNFLLRKGYVRKGPCCCWSEIERVHQCSTFKFRETPEFVFEPLIFGCLKKNNQNEEQKVENGIRTEEINNSLFLTLKDAAMILTWKNMMIVDDKASIEKIRSYSLKAKKIAESHNYRLTSSKIAKLSI